MGISGLLPQLGPPSRTSLAKLASTHYTAHSRPLRLAIDISIWLFQIQSGKGGSNPALRTFYYRLLRLLTLNLHPLFVFDGPNKPLFKRNKKVGGGGPGGARVASVPEFLAKQLLKHFGFPWHVAPGEAEAECALLQREGVVDAVLSEDVDTLMFGSGVTLRNWSNENTTKSPTHVDVYRAEETKERSRGLEREGMILVALMSGGDYLPEGIPGCGIKVACDAARAGLGRELCAISRRDERGLRQWKEKLQHEIRTNESKFFSRKNTNLAIPDDFPNLEVLGYYTHPCVSNPEKISRLRQELRWDQPIDFAALRTFTADAFDWRCRGGAKKFIKNLAPAMLIRELRLRGTTTNNDCNPDDDDQEAQEKHERELVRAIHGKRNHSTTDGELEYRISFIPSTLVPIDLDLEEEDDQFIPAGGGVIAAGDDSDIESEFVGYLPPPSTAAVEDEDLDLDLAPTSPSKKKKRTFRPSDPSQPEKLWILKPWLQIGCPLLVEDYEASFRDPREFLKARMKAKAAAAAVGSKDGGQGEGIHAPRKMKEKRKKKGKDVQENSLMSYTRVTKAGVDVDVGEKNKETGKGRGVLGDLSSNTRAKTQGEKRDGVGLGVEALDLTANVTSSFRLPATQIPDALLRSSPVLAATTTTMSPQGQRIEVLDLANDSRVPPRPFSTSYENPFKAFADPEKSTQQKKKKLTTSAQAAAAAARKEDVQRTPKRNKKPDLPLDPFSPSTAMSQRTITSYYSPSPRKTKLQPPLLSPAAAAAAPPPPPKENEVINLVSSSPAPAERALTPSPPNTRFQFVREDREGKVRLERPVTAAGIGPSRELEFSPGKLPNTVTKRRKKMMFGGLKRSRTEPAGREGVGFDDDYDGEGEIVLPTPTSCDEADDAMAKLGGGFLLDGLDDDLDLFTPRAQEYVGRGGVFSSLLPSSRREEVEVDRWIRDVQTRSDERGSGNEVPINEVSCSAPTASKRVALDLQQPSSRPDTQNPIHPNPKEATSSTTLPFRESPTKPKLSSQPLRRSPRQQKQVVKKCIELRESLEGWWKEVDADTVVDMSGDGSGWKKSGGRAEILGWRKSGVEVLDLTGA